MTTQKGYTAHHFVTAQGVPDGGQSYGIGFTIAWQRGSLLKQSRNGAFLIEVLESCLDKLKLGFFCAVSTGIGYTIAWDTGVGATNLQAKPDDVLRACLDELIHKHECFPCKENELAIYELGLVIAGKRELKIERLKKVIDLMNQRLERRKQEGTLYDHKENPYHPENEVIE